MKRMYLSFVFLLLILLSSCSFFSSEDKAKVIEYEKKISELESKLNATLEYGQPKIEDKGNFNVVYNTTADLNFKDMQALIQEEGDFNVVIGDINDFFSLPKNVTILFTECGFENALYEPWNKTIIMCYDLMNYFKKPLAYYTSTKAELNNLILGATYFIFFHEVGHALVDVLQLPTTGKEEDVADQLATFLLSLGESSEQIALIASGLFFVESKRRKFEEIPFWDAHSIDRSRYYNIACWVYGKDPEKYSGLLKRDFLPEERALTCEWEYNKMWDSWAQLLWPYLKPECDGCLTKSVCYMNKTAKIFDSKVLYCYDKEWVTKETFESRCGNCSENDNAFIENISESNTTNWGSRGLAIDSINVWVNREKRGDIVSNLKIDALRGGDHVKIEIIFGNEKPISLNATIMINSLGNNMESTFRLLPVEQKTVSFEETIPLWTDKGFYNVTINSNYFEVPLIIDLVLE